MLDAGPEKKDEALRNFSNTIRSRVVLTEKPSPELLLLEDYKAS